MSLLRLGAITDDAGKRCRLVDRAGMSEWPSKGDQRIDALVTRIRRAMSARSATETVLNVLIVVGALVLYSLTRGLFYQVFPRLPVYSYFLIVAVGVMLLGRALWRSRLHASRRHVARFILEEGLCPCCGYNFHGVPSLDVPPDHHVVCPECGGSWRRGRIERALPFATNDSLKSPIPLFAKREKLGSWSIKDDRGGPFRLVHPRLRALRDSVLNEAHRAAIVRANERVRWNGLWFRVAVALALAVVALAFIIGAAAARNSVGARLFVASIFIGLAFWAMFGNLAYSPRRFTRQMLEEHLCPTCGEDLSAEAPSHDGCTVCPDCRAAWRIPAKDE